MEAREREWGKERQTFYKRITRLERINGIMQGVKSCPVEGCPFVNAMKAEASADPSQDSNYTSCHRQRD